MTTSRPASSPVHPAGDLFDLLDLDQFTNGHPYAAYARLRAEAPIYWQSAESPEPGFWILSRYSDIQYVSRNPETFCSGRGFKAADESFERALRRFKKKCEKAGILSDLRKHRHYEKPSEAKRRKTQAAERRRRRQSRRKKPE